MSDKYLQRNTELFENPMLKKKMVWEKVTAVLDSKGYRFSQKQVEGKWKGMVKCYKLHRDSRNKTGKKRCVFPYYEEIEAIL